MDLRQKKSRESIIDAFRHLITTQRYQEITVQNIIAVANVSRSTFYVHFDKKDSLLEETCSELFDHVILKLDRLSPATTPNVRFESMITHILNHIYKNASNILDLLSSESSELFLLYFKQSLRHVVGNQLDNKLKLDGLPKDYVLNFIVNSFVDTVNWWIQGGLKQLPLLIESYYYTLISTFIKK